MIKESVIPFIFSLLLDDSSTDPDAEVLDLEIEIRQDLEKENKGHPFSN